MYRMFPFVAAARRGLEEIVPQMPKFLDHARNVASALRRVPERAAAAPSGQPELMSMFYVAAHTSGERHRYIRAVVAPPPASPRRRATS